MDNAYKLLACLVLASFALVSCNEEEMPHEGMSADKEQVESGDKSSSERIRLCFSVSTENEANPVDLDSKTTWDKTDGHKWSDDDQIRIIWAEGTEGYVDANVVNGRVSAEVGDAEYYYAVYPTTAMYSFDNTAGSITFTIPRYQSGALKEADMMAAKTSKADLCFEFNSMVHLLKITVPQSNQYKAFTFTSNTGAGILGSVTTSFAKDGGNLACSTAPSGQYLNNGTPSSATEGSSNSLAAGMTYYFAVVPGAEFPSGIAFKAREKNKKDGWQAGALSTNPITASRAKITNLGNIESWIHKQWYIKVGGTGKGTSWDDAGGASRLVQLLAPTGVYGMAASWRLYEADIYIAKGEYNLQAANSNNVLSPNWGQSNVTRIHGGYPEMDSGNSTEGQDVVNNETIFVCNQAADGDRILDFRLSGVADLTFDGITFKSQANPTNTNSSGIVASYTVSDAKKSGKITFTRCTFSGFKSSASGGASFYLKPAGTLEMNFINCTADDNDIVSPSTASGGFLYQDGGTVNIKGGTIKNCNTYSANGGAIYQKTGTLNIMEGENDVSPAADSTKFIANSASGKRGGAILSQGTVSISKAVFSNNSASNGACVHTEGGALTIYDSSFYGNTATNGTALRTAGGSTVAYNKLLVFNSLFKNNIASTAASNGGIYQGTGYALALFANCTFKTNTANVVLRPTGTNSYIYAVSCTMDNACPNIIDANEKIVVRNSILMGGTSSVASVVKTNTIWQSTLFKASNSDSEALDSFVLGSFDVGKGVYLLDSSHSTSYGQGMSAENLKSLTFEKLTLTSEGEPNQIDFLAKDQKGTTRRGTIMGAYVGTDNGTSNDPTQ